MSTRPTKPHENVNVLLHKVHTHSTSGDGLLRLKELCGATAALCDNMKSLTTLCSDIDDASFALREQQPLSFQHRTSNHLAHDLQNATLGHFAQYAAGTDSMLQLAQRLTWRAQRGSERRREPKAQSAVTAVGFITTSLTRQPLSHQRAESIKPELTQPGASITKATD